MEHISAAGLAVKSILTLFCAWLSARFGALVPVMGILLLAMALDFATAWAACIATGESITSKRGGQGIIKKGLYIAIVIAGLVVDWLILVFAGYLGLAQPVSPVFGLLVAVWLILNELVSILENVQRAGVVMPGFLMAVVQRLKIRVEEKGNTHAERED